MKKSNFLKSSKELLSRSFNPSKCKTALKLAGSRMKLLRNKKEAQLKQIKREIAQLLESGQDQTARIRVENVVREEKMMAAYDLIEIYCELIAARMHIIETQKICANDLKEAITSVIFASPRCGDVPELKDVKKHFTEKYGKDFVTAAVELRPQTGVSHLLVEKLSSTAPDGPTKIKILSAIAEEHNVKWDPKSFEESDSTPPSDLLKGPRTFEETSLYVEPLHTESPDVQAPQSNHRIHGSLSNLSDMDHMSSMGTGVYTSVPTPGINTAFHREARTQGDKRPQFSPGDSNSTHLDRQRWNMEFKDAAAAAHAAAESAELASMAARAAAELSSRDKFTRQYSAVSHNAGNDSEHRGPDAYVDSKLFKKQIFEQRRYRSFSENTGIQNEQIDGMQLNNPNRGGRFSEDSPGGMKELTQSTTLKSRASIHDNSLDHDVPGVYSYSQKNSLQEVSRGETNTQRPMPEKYYDVREDRIFDDVNIFANYEDQKFKSDTGEDPFLSSRTRGVSEQTSHESSAAAFNKSDSDSNIRGFNSGPTYDDHDPGFHLPSGNQKSHKHLPVDPHPGSRRSSSGIGNPASSPLSTRKDSSGFLANSYSVNNLKEDNSVKVTYDNPDESSSESDVDMNMSSRIGLEDSRNLPSKYNQPVRRQHIDQPAAKHRNPEMEPNDIGKSSPDNDGAGLQLGRPIGGLRHKGNNPPPILKIQKDTPSYFGEKPEVATATITRPTVPASSESPRTSTIYERKKSKLVQDFHSGAASDSSEEEESLRKRSGQNPRQCIAGAGKEVKIKPSLASSNSNFTSDNSDPNEDPPKESLARMRHRQNGISQRTKPPPFNLENSYSRTHFGSKTLDFDDDMDGKPTTSSSESLHGYESLRNSSKLETYEQQPASSKVASKPAKSNFWGPPEPYSSAKAASLTAQESKIRHGSEPRDFDADAKRESTNYYTPETRHQYPSLTKTSSQLGNSETHTSVKTASRPSNSSLWGTSDQRNSRKANSATMQESKTWNSSAREESSSTHKKTEGVSISSENPQAAMTLNKTPSNKDGSNQRPSHVHPKLPDYDTLVQTLRKNRP